MVVPRIPEKVQVPTDRLVPVEKPGASPSKFWSLTASNPRYELIACEANAMSDVTSPICASSSQSPPWTAEPVGLLDAATSAPVACTNWPMKSASTSPLATLQP